MRFLIITCLLLLLQLHHSLQITIEEAGKFDWLKQNIGDVLSASFQSKTVYFRTQMNVIGALNTRNGALEWRRVFEGESVDLMLHLDSDLFSYSIQSNVLRRFRAHDGIIIWDSFAPVMSCENKDLCLDNQYINNDYDIFASSVMNIVAILANNNVYIFSFSTGELLSTWYPTQEHLTTLGNNFSPDAVIDLQQFGAIESKLTVIGTISNAESHSELLLVHFERSTNLRQFSIKVEAFEFDAQINHENNLVFVQPTIFQLNAPQKESIVASLTRNSDILLFDLDSHKQQTVDISPLLKKYDASRVKSFQALEGSSDSLLVLHFDNNVKIVVSIDISKMSLNTLAHCAQNKNCLFAAFTGQKYGEAPRVFIATIVSEKSSNIITSTVIDASNQHLILENEAKDLMDFSLEKGISRVFLQVFEKKEAGLGYRFLLTTNDCVLTMVQTNKGIIWKREEALSQVSQVEFVDESHTAGHSKENALHFSKGIEIPSLKERFEMQKNHLISKIRPLLNILSSGEPQTALKEFLSPSQYDDIVLYGKNKLILCMTKHSKLFALRLTSAEIVWSKLVTPNTQMIVLKEKEGLRDFPEVVLISPNEVSPGLTDFILLDALTGEEIQRMVTDKKVISVFPIILDEQLNSKILFVLLEEGHFKLFPQTDDIAQVLSPNLLSNLYYHKFHEEENAMTSYQLIANSLTNPTNFASHSISSFNLPKNEKVLGIVYPSKETVKTQTHVLGDDSLLLKYLNNKLAVVITQVINDSQSTEQSSTNNDPNSRDESSDLEGSTITPIDHETNPAEPTLFITLVDTVSGTIISRVSHLHASGPVHAVLTQNWVIYSYFNIKSNRVEIGSITLHDGMIDRYGLNPFKKPDIEQVFSSFSARVPIALQQTFVFPRGIRALSSTATVRGITSKAILVGMSNGQVYSLDHRLLDPRRPVDKITDRDKAEGLIPYSPFIPIIPLHIVSYHQQVESLREIYAVPSRLESTSLTFAVGLDLLFVHVSPSKTFDILAADFNYLLLLTILTAMVIGLFVVSKLLKTKNLKANWK